jgi:hypothetical protein
MKVAIVLTVVGLATAAVFTEGMAGNTYLLNPVNDNIVQQLPWGGQRVVRNLPGGRIVRVLETNLPKERTYRKTFNEQRVIRQPISKTMTVLPNEVTRVQRNIQTHLPMVHDRLRYHYSVEDVNNQKMIHHFVEPVEENYLGTRKGRSNTVKTQHKLYRDMKFNPETYTDIEDGEIIEGGTDLKLREDGETFATDTEKIFHGEKFWKVNYDESCADMPTGTILRPQAVCFSDVQVDDGECNDLDYPEDIQC